MRARRYTRLVPLSLLATLGVSLLGSPNVALAQETASSNDPIVDVIQVEGNRAVQAEAIKALMSVHERAPANIMMIRRDIRELFKSGYFSDVQIDQVARNGKLVLIVRVVEKPSISEIKLDGFSTLGATAKDKLSVKMYTIVDEKKIAADVRTLEQMYIEKGYYLAKVGYTLTPSADGTQVVLSFNVQENNPVVVRKIQLLGNRFYSDRDLKARLLLKERRNTSFLDSSGNYRDEFAAADKQNLEYIYKDNGFAEANVATPQSRLDPGRENIDVSYSVEEGERFNIGTVKFSGDLLWGNDTLLGKVQQKNHVLYRYSQFYNDMKTLQDLYGDEGYAFVDINPKVTLDRAKRLFNIEWHITKGEKAFFRKIYIEGNTNTRDNVIRRNVKVAEGERFHATRIEKSKAAIERLGFFAEVQVLKEPDPKNRAVDLRIKVKEKLTGQLSASLGASPDSSGSFGIFADASFNQANLYGRGWATGLKMSFKPHNGKTDYGLDLSFTEPSVMDGPWSLSANASYKLENSTDTESEKVVRRIMSKSIGVSLGREVFVEDLRMSVGYNYDNSTTDPNNPLTAMYNPNGVTEKIIETVSYDNTDNFLNPTSGFNGSVRNEWALKLTKGQYRYGRLSSTLTYYIPLPFTDEFRTNFRFTLSPAYVYQTSEDPVPYWERLKLGSIYDMKAYSSTPIGPTVSTMTDPQKAGSLVTRNKRGNRRLYSAAEYFVPLIPEANLRGVTFYEAGTVLDDGQALELSGFKHDIGFGFRWQTPVAPFRFEWAWPLQNGKLGEMQFVFSIGGDGQGAF